MTSRQLNNWKLYLLPAIQFLNCGVNSRVLNVLQFSTDRQLEITDTLTLIFLSGVYGQRRASVAVRFFCFIGVWNLSGFSLIKNWFLKVSLWKHLTPGLISLVEKKLKSLNLAAEICPDSDSKTPVEIRVKKFITTIANILLSNYW